MEASQCGADASSDAESNTSLTPDQAWSVFLVLAGGAVLSVLIALIEVLYYKKAFSRELHPRLQCMACCCLLPARCWRRPCAGLLQAHLPVLEATAATAPALPHACCCCAGMERLRTELSEVGARATFKRRMLYRSAVDRFQKSLSIGRSSRYARALVSSAP